MTLKLQLSSRLEETLKTEATKNGMPVEAYALSLLEQRMPTPAERNRSLHLLVGSWLEGDAAEQKETGEYLIRALDEDRLADRPHFPAAKKGLSW